MLGVIKKLFGSKHEKDVKALRPLIEEINRYYEEYQNLTDDELKAKTVEFRNRIQEAIKESEAVVREADETALPHGLDLQVVGVKARRHFAAVAEPNTDGTRHGPVVGAEHAALQ